MTRIEMLKVKRGEKTRRCLAERERRHDHQRMQLELVTQLPFGDKDGVQEFLDLGVASLGIRQDLANKVHRTQYF